MLTLAVALALATSPVDASPEQRCGLARLSACRNTNVLVLDAGFQRALRTFAGQPRTDFLGDGKVGPLAQELIEVLHGPPDQPQQLNDGSFLFTACKAHECLNKGAVVLSSTGEILAAAMITESSVDRGDRTTTHQLLVDVFVRNRLQQQWREVLGPWADGAAKEWRTYLQNMKWSAEGISRRLWLITPTGKLRNLER